jgi:hypothetical protein
MKLRGFDPNSYIDVSVSDLYIPCLFFYFFILFVCVGRVPHPTSQFSPDLILYVNLVAMWTT